MRLFVSHILKLVKNFQYRWHRSNSPFPSSGWPLCQKETILIQICFTYSFIFMQVKLIFMWKVFHEDSFWHRCKPELRNGLFKSWIIQNNWPCLGLSSNTKKLCRADFPGLIEKISGGSLVGTMDLIQTNCPVCTFYANNSFATLKPGSHLWNKHKH